MAVANESIENQSSVTISGETFDITEAPSADSAYVQQQLVKVAAGIDVSKLDEELRDMGRFTRIALHFAVVKGDFKLVGNIKEIGKRLAKLCDESAIAIGRFHRTSTTVIETLQAGYSFLLEGLESMALDNLEDVQQEAKTMQAISEDLQSQFEKAATEVESVQWGNQVSDEEKEMSKLLEEAKLHGERIKEQAEKAMENLKSEDEDPGFLLKEVKKEHEEEIKKKKQAIEDARKNKCTAEEKFSGAEDLLRQQIRDKKALICQKDQAMEIQKRDLGRYTQSEAESKVRDLEAFLGNGFKRFWSSGATIHSKESEKEQLEQTLKKVATQEETIRKQMDQITLQEETITQQRDEVAQRKSKVEKYQKKMEKEQQALDQLESKVRSMAEKLKSELIKTIDKKMQQDHASAAIDIIAAIKENLMAISVTMIQIRGFWQRMAVTAKELQSQRVRNRVEEQVRTTSPEQRLRIWTSKGFKMDAIANYANWVSYGVLCDKYMRGITTTRAEVYACLKERILPSQAVEQLGLLVPELNRSSL